MDSQYLYDARRQLSLMSAITHETFLRLSQCTVIAIVFENTYIRAHLSWQAFLHDQVVVSPTRHPTLVAEDNCLKRNNKRSSICIKHQKPLSGLWGGVMGAAGIKGSLSRLWDLFIHHLTSNACPLALADCCSAQVVFSTRFCSLERLVPLF